MYKSSEKHPVYITIIQFILTDPHGHEVFKLLLFDLPEKEKNSYNY